MDQVLDGKTAVKPVPFDAHDRVLHAPHMYEKGVYKKAGEAPGATSADGPDITHPQATEYPKAVAHNEEKTEPVVARDADHEVELLDKIEEDKAKESAT